MESGGDQGGVPLSMIPLLEVAYSKCQEEEKDDMQLQKGTGVVAHEVATGKKRKRASNWTEAETLQLLILRKGQLHNKDDRKIFLKGSNAWDEIASQLKEHFPVRSGKHVGERWDTLRRVYMDIEERCSKTNETYTEVLDANKNVVKFIPTEYTLKWHELIADCKPGKRRGKKPIGSGNSQKVDPSPLLVEPAPSKVGTTIEDCSATSYRAPLEACSEGNAMHETSGDAAYVQHESSPTSVPHSPGIASAFGSLIKDIERVITGQTKQDKSCGRTYTRRGRDKDDRAGEARGVELSENSCDAVETNVVSSLLSVFSALKSASEFTSSESYLLKIDKREWNLVEHSVRVFSERHRNIEQPRINGVGKPFQQVVWPPDDPDPITVTHDDIKSLEPGGQSSDSVVNFHLKGVET